MDTNERLFAGGGRSLDRNLLIFFSIAFFARLLERLGYWLGLAAKQLSFDDYPLTEWLINYQGGFFRRGLTGSILLWLWQSFRLPPALVIVTVSFSVFLALGVYLWMKAKGKVPRWTLFTTPLLGYPVFVNGIMLRKDIFMVLFIALSLELITSKRFRGGDWIAGLLMSFLVLSHEVSFFLGFLILVCVVVLREFITFAQSRNIGEQSQGFVAILSINSQKLVWLLMPIVSFIVVALRGRATNATTSAIASSWKSAYNPSLSFPGAGGAIGWLSKSLQEGVQCSKGTFAMTVYGVPYWIIILLAIISGIMLLAAAISAASPVRAWFFALSALLEFLFMSPIFYTTCDHGRWVILALMISFILSIQVPLAWQEQVARLTQFPDQLRDFRVPPVLAPLGLAFWGLSVVIWCPFGAPIAVLLQIYFYLRLFGFIPRLSL
jgi:hypothetical protein